MFITYYSNQPEQQKETLLHLLENTFPLDDPFSQEVILVQSPGMAQWLQMAIAQKRGVAANFTFPLPASFIWQLYADNLPDVTAQNPFNKTAMTWRLMRLIPKFLHQPQFAALNHYLAASPQSEQQKLYQLSAKIADLFDQYLVYRPDWITAWEHHQDERIQQAILNQQYVAQNISEEQLVGSICWQGILWRALIADCQQDLGSQVAHRAELNRQFLALCASDAPMRLPERVFVFGIPALPGAYFSLLQALAKRIDVHFFFNNPCREYWAEVSQGEVLNTPPTAAIGSGNRLLFAWGKMGRDFLYSLSQEDGRVIGHSLETYREFKPNSLLGQIQNQILNLMEGPLLSSDQDRSLTFNSCHSAMREVEVLHDYLLGLFNQNASKPQEEWITPKDVVVMVADINQYTPYIQAVFGQVNDEKTAIPFSISDNRLADNDVLAATLISLLHFKENRFAAEDILALLDVPAIREQFSIGLNDLPQIRQWVADAGIRFGVEKNDGGINFNAWQAGLERMSLGFAMREEHGVWGESLGLDGSFGLKGQLVGGLAAFFQHLASWHRTLQQDFTIEQWQSHLLSLLDTFFSVSRENTDSLFYLQDCINHVSETLADVHFDLPISAEVVADVLTVQLAEIPNNQRFLAGKVNFCTLLPMRAIPFKVVCLLGMNDADYPRQQSPNSFDLMQYHHMRGDRVRREDDRYLFLEALLSARDYFYLSYIGSSIIDNQAQEPSVLVNQLLSYLQRGLQTNTALVQTQAMTAFSAQNFDLQNPQQQSFAAKWLPLAQGDITEHEFIVPFAEIEPFDEIAIEDLIRFVERPLKFFFERRLGVYFREEDEQIADHENFQLSGLDNYSLNNQLLDLSEEEFDDFFTRQAIKGILPRSGFASVYAEKTIKQVQEFKNKIADYRALEATHEDIDLELAGEFGTFRLTGQLSSLLGEQKQCVIWYFANDKERYRVRPWIYYLLQLQHREDAPTPLLFVKDKVNPIGFKSISKEEALFQLKIYLDGFCRAACQPLPIPTENISKYLSLIGQQDIQQKFTSELVALAENDPYWQRLLGQTQFFSRDENIEHLLQQMQQWFAKMLQK